MCRLSGCREHQTGLEPAAFALEGRRSASCATDAQMALPPSATTMAWYIPGSCMSGHVRWAHISLNACRLFRLSLLDGRIRTCILHRAGSLRRCIHAPAPDVFRHLCNESALLLFRTEIELRRRGLCESPQAYAKFECASCGFMKLHPSRQGPCWQAVLAGMPPLLAWCAGVDLNHHPCGELATVLPFERPAHVCRDLARSLLRGMHICLADTSMCIGSPRMDGRYMALSGWSEGQVLHLHLSAASIRAQRVIISCRRFAFSYPRTFLPSRQ